MGFGIPPRGRKPPTVLLLLPATVSNAVTDTPTCVGAATWSGRTLTGVFTAAFRVAGSARRVAKWLLPLVGLTEIAP